MKPSTNKQFTLHELIILNRKAEFLERISSDKDIDAVNSEGLTPLHIALSERNLELSMTLIEKGADVNKKGLYGKTPLHYALTINRDIWEKADNEVLDVYPLLELLLKKGAKINELSGSDSSPLLFLCEFYDEETDVLKACKLFIYNGAEINIMDSHSETPLFHAVDRDNFELVKLLIENGADVNLGEYSNFPIIEANDKKESPEIVKLLVENGTNVNVCEDDDRFETALSQQMFAFANEHIVKMLLEKGANVNCLGLGEESPLHYAACYGIIPTMKVILEYKPNVNLRNCNGDTPLHHACSKGNLEAVQLLIQSGANINIRNNDNQTPFYFAAVNNHFVLVQYLLEIGYNLELEERKSILIGMITNENMDFEITDFFWKADININELSREGKPLLYFALEQRDKKRVSYLLEKGADPAIVPEWNPLSIYAMSNHTEEIKELLRAGNIFSLSADYRDPIYTAIKYKNKQIAKLIYKEAVKRNIPRMWNYFNNSLFFGNVYMASYFLKNGYSIEYKDDKNNPAIFSAVEGGHVSSLKFLIKKGININEKNKDGKSAIFIACEKEQVEIAELLFKMEADLIEPNSVSPYYFAAKYWKKEIINLLLQYTKDINLTDKFGLAPLHYFVKESSYFYIEQLIRRGANPHIKTKDGDTVIHLSVHNNGHSTKSNIELFLELGVDVNAQNNSGDTALHIVVKKSNEKIIRLLLKKGADVSLRNNDGNSPLELSYNTNLRIQGLLEKFYNSL